ncbi:unnamed protein product [Strongylus vulgaris]|uniref:Uncharacterized protein n=1 Tax=Strongylus vulgaris TaxID=40348 RepID=A0A3P7J1B4_STRVU|nr:unnamed protein product [Strongylus vulgaris]
MKGVEFHDVFWPVAHRVEKLKIVACEALPHATASLAAVLENHHRIVNVSAPFLKAWRAPAHATPLYARLYTLKPLGKKKLSSRYLSHTTQHTRSTPGARCPRSCGRKHSQVARRRSHSYDDTVQGKTEKVYKFVVFSM